MLSAFVSIAKARPFAKSARMFAVLRAPDTTKRRDTSAIKICMSQNGLFVDQTAYIPRLFTEADIKVQLALPRRFRKTTFLRLINDMCSDDAEEALAGTELANSGFFKNKEKWDPPYSVIRFNFALLKNLEPQKFEKLLFEQMKDQCIQNQFPVREDDVPEGRLKLLLEFLNMTRKKQPVVIVDEYDIPVHGNNNLIIDMLDRFYSPLKENDLIKKLIMFGTHNVYHDIGTSTNDTADLILQSPFYNMLGFTREHLEEIFSDDDPYFLKHTPPNFSLQSAKRKILGSIIRKSRNLS